MENLGKTKQQGPVDAPPSSLNQLKQSGFDSSVDMKNMLIHQNRPTRFHSEVTAVEQKTRGGHVQSQSMTSSPQSTQPQGLISHVSICMPSSPLTMHMERSPFADDVGSSAALQTITSGYSDGVAQIAEHDSSAEPRQVGFHPPRSSLTEGSPNGGLGVANNNNNPRIDRFKDRTFDSFKTWSGKFERQRSNLRGKQPATPPAGPPEATANPEIERLPVDRYFDALEGPELETLRASEVLMLPEDRKWPFLLRFPISCFGICLGVSSQAIMWETLATSPSMAFLHVTPKVNLVLWSVSVALVGLISGTYALKAILYFEAVRREYYHPIRVNFFFAPWIALLFLALGVPPRVAQSLHPAAWYALMAPILALELKIYGQWMSGGQRRLSMVANPSNHLSVVGNFVGALLGASMGLREGPIFFFSVGLAHYTVLFVTLYQRLPTNATLPKELHPVFFLFVAAPSVASMAWAKIHGSFDDASRIAYFIALFLYFSLAVRVNFFRGFRFSVAWWAYTFPMTGASIATIKYSIEVTNVVTQALSILLSATATLTVTSLLVTTIIHAFVLRDLLPNDIAIAISDRRSKHTKKWFHHHRRHSSSDTKDIENYLKFADDGHSDAHVAN